MRLISVLTPILATTLLSFSASSTPEKDRTASFKAMAPAPIFPMDTWVDYIKSHDYKSFPELIGFTPLIDSATGNVKTSPVPADKYGVNIPLVLKCEDPNGCRGYKLYATPAFVGMAYKDRTALMNLKTNSLNTIIVPSDIVGHNGIIVDVRSKYAPNGPNGPSTCTKDLMCYGGYSENDHDDRGEYYDLVTPYKGVIAILYLDKNKLKSTMPMDGDGPFNFEEWSNGQFQFNFNFPGLRVTSEPYLTNGYVWKSIDSGFTAPRTEWRRKESFATGISNTEAFTLSVEIGMKVGYSNGGAPGPTAELSTTMTSTWGQTWTSTADHSIETEMTCSNLDGTTPLLCGVYQKYGTTKMSVPGYENDNYYFKLFNNDSRVKGRWFSLQTGVIGSDVTTDDTNEPIGALYPVAGTLEPAGNLNAAQPTIEIPRA